MRILIIQTAFIGDVILATALLESLCDKYPDARIDFLVRKGNESLFTKHPKLNQVLIWDKKKDKLANLKKLITQLRNDPYDVLFNLQRFGSSGLMSWRSKAKTKIGFKKNPFSFSYDHKVEHKIEEGVHEIHRNFALLETIGEFELRKPKLYPSEEAINKAVQFKEGSELVVMAPSSVWFTKQMPLNKWVELIDQHSNEVKISLIGGPNDQSYIEEIIQKSSHLNIHNMAGRLNLLESAAFIAEAKMTHVNDSAPLHLASAMNSPVTAYYCSTVPNFGFGPLSTDNQIVEVSGLDCRPCGLHGKNDCPKSHFKCGHDLDVTIR